MTGFPNLQSNPAGATPVWVAPPITAANAHITTDVYTQVFNAAGGLTGLSVNTAGTTSTATLYDGNSSVVTITIASPGVITWAAHAKAAGTAIKFQTTGALPTGLTAGTTYYVSSATLTNNTFVLADTRAHAIAGTNSINTSGTQSGVHTAYDVTTVLAVVDTTARGVLAFPAGGFACALGILVITASGGAADLSVFYRT